MEPSGNWLRTEAEGSRKVSEGCVNFSVQLNGQILASVMQKIPQHEEISELGMKRQADVSYRLELFELGPLEDDFFCLLVALFSEYCADYGL